MSFTVTQDNINDSINKNYDKLVSNSKKLEHLLAEGRLIPEYIIENVNELLHTMRNCNVNLRWILLHRKAQIAKLRDYINETYDKDIVLQLLMKTAQYESKLQAILMVMIENKEKSWEDDKF
jgi:WASH complex subunit strumpellin